MRFVMMKSLLLLHFFIFCISAQSNLTFPPDFIFGAATASYQVEGAWNTNGKGENIWDRMTHSHPEWIADTNNADIACDTYSHTQVDVQLLRAMGVNFYRFSLSWSRILPNGYANVVNQDGIRYYNELIDALLANGILPYITLYHWDLPQPLQEIGGWPNPVVAQIFEDYARVTFEAFGDRVKNWMTFNEPRQVCLGGYDGGSLAPNVHSPGIGCYLCGYTLLMAHAKAYRLYDSTYRPTQGGRVGIAVDSFWNEPNTNSTADIEAAEATIQMNYGWYVHPIYSTTGDYPPIMKTKVEAMSLSEGFSKSRLPEFTAEEKFFIQGTSDFLGLNHYSTNLCYPANDSDGEHPSHWRDVGVICYQDPSWPSSAAGWLKVVPWGFRKLMNWIKNEYGNPEIIITENGFADNSTDELKDFGRVDYYNNYLTAVLSAIHEDGCNVKGYTAWSFLDNFEWNQGFTQRFGLYHVNFTDINRTRTAKMSSLVYKNIITTRIIDWNYLPEPTF